MYPSSGAKPGPGLGAGPPPAWRAVAATVTMWSITHLGEGGAGRQPPIPAGTLAPPMPGLRLPQPDRQGDHGLPRPLEPLLEGQRGVVVQQRVVPALALEDQLAG